MNVVITGSTKGIGCGMAREFLKRGHNVVISSRRPDAVEQVAKDLRSIDPSLTVAGVACDVKPDSSSSRRERALCHCLANTSSSAPAARPCGSKAKRERETLARAGLRQRDAHFSGPTGGQGSSPWRVGRPGEPPV